MKQNRLRVSLVSEDFAADDVEVIKLEGKEHIAELFEFNVLVVHRNPEPIELDDLVGALASLVFEQHDEQVRRIHGMIGEAELLYETENDHNVYRLRIVPRLWLLTLVKTVNIHMDVSIPEIIEEKLASMELGGSGVDYELRLAGNYPKREFVVQYKESDFAFLSRLTEHLGISYFFEHDDGCDKIVFVDQGGGFSKLAEDNTVTYRGRGEHTDVYRLSTRRQMIPRAYVCHDYNYRNPRLDLTSVHLLNEGDAGGSVEYGGHFKTPAEGKQLVEVRAQERLSRQRVHIGHCDLPLFSAGRVVFLTGHPKVAGTLLLTHVEHSAVLAEAGEFSELLGEHGGHHYEVKFDAIDAQLNYRPERKTAIPKIHGAINAVVETDSNITIQKYAKIDSHGRYTVRFAFDLAPDDERTASRPVRLMQPLAGPNYGFHFPLRPGIEVLVVFIDGDPDRPLIIGAVPNPITPSPVDAANATKSRIRTESGILIEFDDGLS